jgi:hypothetical protein
MMIPLTNPNPEHVATKNILSFCLREGSASNIYDIIAQSVMPLQGTTRDEKEFFRGNNGREFEDSNSCSLSTIYYKATRAKYTCKQHLSSILSKSSPLPTTIVA